MAEMFEKPKKFSGEWFRYVWDYYKVHILVAVAVIALIAVTVVEVLNTVHYDVNINYIASNVLSFDVSDNLANKAAEQIEDGNGDGEKHVSVTQLNFTDEAMQNANQIMALENKLMTVFASEDEMMFVFDEAMLKDVLDMSATEGVFVPVSQWADGDLSEELLYEYGGGVYAVNLKNSAILKEMGIDASDMFVAVRMNYKPEDEKLQKSFENCVTLANSLIKES
ncbi:hypothetical protein [Congzhengia sp.]|uniref:hypothetical protein n=1 Tax=Congzhengia sp. TaxID=2944168 RepID=UPI0030772929